MSGRKHSSILYFASEGRENLSQVLRVVRKAIRRRPELRSLKCVIFTAGGEGPALACTQLHDYDSHNIIAVTYPPGCSIRVGETVVQPKISDRLYAFLTGVGVRVITGRLPFDRIEGFTAHGDQMALIERTLSLFGGGFNLIIQAVLSACDAGVIRIGEEVIGISGDIAAIITASTTQKFLSKSDGLSVNEILCKPRNLTFSRSVSGGVTIDVSAPSKKFDENVVARKITELNALPDKKK